MTEGHLTKGDLTVSPLIDSRTESVRTANDKRKVPAGTHLPLQEVGILDGPIFASVFVQ